MEVKPGYKHTEVGVIPVEWDVRTMGSLTTLMTNGFVGTATSAYVDSEDGVLYVQGYNVQENGFNFHGIKRVSRSFHSRNQKSRLRPGDLLTIQTGDIGVTAVVPTELAGANCHALVISRFDERASDPRFFCQYFNSEPGRSKFKEIETGSTMKHLNVGDMKLLLLPSPPVEEQRVIATALSDVDALLGGLDRLIVKKRDLKQAVMQQLLTGQTRLPGFHGEWQLSELRQCARFCSGTYLAQEAYRDGPFEVQGAGSPMGKHVAANFAEPISVIGRVGTVGRPRFMPFGCWVNNNAGAIVALPGKAVPRFVHLLLLTMDWSKATSVTAQPFLVIESLMKMEFRLPQVLEQTAIAEVLTDMDLELAALEQQREKTRALKKAMMQELLTGRTRLVRPESGHA